jgi:hypothetical protein
MAVAGARLGHPGLLQPAQGDGGGGVAGQHDDAGPRLEQPFAAGPGEVDDLLALATAVGGVGLVGQIDEVPLRKAAGQFAVDRQPAHAGVENAYRHGRAL